MKKGILEKMYAGNVELSDVKVDLGLIQDIDKKIESTKKESQKAFEYKQNAKSLLFDAVTSEKIAIKEYQSTLVQSYSIVKSIKELGLPENEINDKIDLLKRYIKEHENNLQSLLKVNGLL